MLFTSGRDWPYGSALGFILMILTLGGTLLALRIAPPGDVRVSGRERPQPLAVRPSRSLIYAFLFAPIVVLIMFSFNNSRRTFVWHGFTLDWYPKLFANADLLDALRVTLIVAVDRRRRVDDPRARCSGSGWPGSGSAAAARPRRSSSCRW